jgi:hypothetical protein
MVLDKAIVLGDLDVLKLLRLDTVISLDPE